jgi:hypothetical protein
MKDSLARTPFEDLWRGRHGQGEEATVCQLSDRGITCVLVGYAVDHDGDCYEMLDVNDGTIYVTRDIVWLKRMYFSTSPTIDDDGAYLPIHMPYDAGVRESKPLAANDHEDDDAVIPHNNEDDTDVHAA